MAGMDQLRTGVLDQLVVADAGRTGADAGKAAEARLEMTGNTGIELQLSGFDRPQSMNAATGGIHLTGQHPVAGTGGQAEPAVDAWVGLPASAAAGAAVPQPPESPAATPADLCGNASSSACP